MRVPLQYTGDSLKGIFLCTLSDLLELNTTQPQIHSYSSYIQVEPYLGLHDKRNTINHNQSDDL